MFYKFRYIILFLALILTLSYFSCSEPEKEQEVIIRPVRYQQVFLSGEAVPIDTGVVPSYTTFTKKGFLSPSGRGRGGFCLTTANGEKRKERGVEVKIVSRSMANWLPS